MEMDVVVIHTPEETGKCTCCLVGVQLRLYGYDFSRNSFFPFHVPFGGKWSGQGVWAEDPDPIVEGQRKGNVDGGHNCGILPPPIPKYYHCIASQQQSRPRNILTLDFFIETGPSSANKLIKIV